MRKIQIKINSLKLEATVFDTPTGETIYNSLPLKASVNCWGDEIYFSIPVNMDEEHDAREEVEVGDLAFWPVGSAFCIFFGPTPMSSGSTPRAASPVNVFGKINGEIDELKNVTFGSTVSITKIN